MQYFCAVILLFSTRFGSSLPPPPGGGPGGQAGPGYPLLLSARLIRARTGEGRKRAKARGVRFGRPRKMTSHQRQEALQRLAAGETLMDVARSYAVHHTTIGRLLGDRPFPGDADLAGHQSAAV
jgi:hypothetical protein